MRHFVLSCGLSALVVTPALVLAGPGVPIDGHVDGSYGPARAVQTVGTQFGNSNIGQPGFANGSELDAGFGYVSGGMLFLTLTGNLESNFNKLEIFIDSGVGGQNRLRGDNADVDFNGLNRMGNDGSGNGLNFDNGFNAGYYITATGGNTGDGNYHLFANYATLPAGGGGAGLFLGGAGNTPTQIIGPNGIILSIDNSNVLGVNNLGSPFDSPPGSVATGLELGIPLAAIGDPTGDIRVCAFINGGGHDFASNQFLGGLPDGFGNLGEPRGIDLRQIAGDQFFTIPIPAPGALGLLALGALAATRRRRA
jgi:hypothetical protein